VEPYQILIVDDEPLQRQLLRDLLEESGLEFQLEEARDGQEALLKVAQRNFDVVLTDKRMPIIDGDEVCRRIRNDLSLPFVPIIMVTGTHTTEELSRSFAAGASDFVRKPYNPLELSARIKSAVQNKRLTDQLDSAESLLFALARMVEAKDETTGDHCTRLAHAAVTFGQELCLDEVQIEALRRGGILHDIGKLGIPDSILLKQGALDNDEWAIMREHTTIGANLCRSLASMKHVVPIILHHHERWDGSGYPHGLAGEKIPLLARVFQLLDIYDALSSERPYKKALSPEKVISILEEEAGKGWRDPELTTTFIQILRLQPEKMRLPDSVKTTRDEDIFESILATGALDWDKKKKG
jgi:putative two-component system response regulator